MLRQPGRTPIRTQEGVRAVDEAIATIKNLPPMRPLTWSRALANAARDHVRDIGSRGTLSHEGSDGSSPRDRISRYLPRVRNLGETISFGPNDARSVIMELLIDDGVRGRGHRKILLDASYRLAGAACGPHKRYRTVCVIDLATAD
jgi:uncharacterized protein YkwD